MSLPHKELFLQQLKVAHTDEECPICQETMTDPRKTPCEHIFCLACLTTWCESANTCPNCRIVLFKELSKDPAFVHMVTVPEDGSEGEHITIDRRDSEAQIVIEGYTLPPVTWRFARLPSDEYDDPAEGEDEEENSGEGDSGDQTEGVNAEVAPMHDGQATEGAETTVATITEEVSGLDIGQGDEVSSNEDDNRADPGPEGPAEQDVEQSDQDSTSEDADERQYLEVERLNFHLDAEVDEDLIIRTLYYIWCTPHSKLTPNLEDQALVHAASLLPRALAVVLFYNPNRLFDTVENLFTWAEVCRKDWVTMGQYLEYKLQELEDEKSEWSGRDLKAELLAGWEAEMTPDMEDSEEGDKVEATVGPSNFFQQRDLAPRVPEYGERLLAHYGESETFSKDVDRLFECVVCFAQNLYKGLPYENWPEGDDTGSDEGDEGLETAEVVLGEDTAGEEGDDETD